MGSVKWGGQKKKITPPYYASGWSNKKEEDEKSKNFIELRDPKFLVMKSSNLRKFLQLVTVPSMCRLAYCDNFWSHCTERVWLQTRCMSLIIIYIYELLPINFYRNFSLFYFCHNVWKLLKSVADISKTFLSELIHYYLVNIPKTFRDDVFNYKAATVQMFPFFPYYYVQDWTLFSEIRLPRLVVFIWFSFVFRWICEFFLFWMNFWLALP